MDNYIYVQQYLQKLIWKAKRNEIMTSQI